MMLVPAKRVAGQFARLKPVLVLLGLGIFSIGTVVFSDFASAGVFIKSPPRFGPAPIIGASLPIAGAVVVAILVARRYRRRR